MQPIQLTSLDGPTTKSIIENLFFIYNKQGMRVPFLLNPVQDYLVRNVVGQPPHKRRHVILKARQHGASTFVLAWFATACMSHHTMAVVISHEEEATRRLLRRLQTMLSMLKVKPAISRQNENEIHFKKTDSLFFIGTAGSKKFSRGDYITHLHMSELAFWPNPDALRPALLEAVVPYGYVIEETTSSGYGTWFHKHFMRAYTKQSEFQAHFIPWHWNPDYKLPEALWQEYPSLLASGFPHSLYPKEQALLEQGVTLEQLAWRRLKFVSDYDGLPENEHLLDREHPSSVEDAFVHSGAKLFSSISVRDGLVPSGPNESKLPHHPQPQFSYILGCDPSGGTGRDFSAICVVCRETAEVVHIWKSNTYSPLKFAQQIIKLANTYNQAFVVIERNSHGISVNEFVRQNYPARLVYKTRPPTSSSAITGECYGFRTTKTSKPVLLNDARNILSQGFKLNSTELYEQLLSFEEDDNDAIVSVAPHDDLAMAFCLACRGLVKLGFVASDDVEDFGEDEALIQSSELERRIPQTSELYCTKDRVPTDDIVSPTPTRRPSYAYI